MNNTSLKVLQISPDYSDPFLYLCGQYAAMLKDSGYQVTTVYLTGKPCDRALALSQSDEVIFLDLPSTRGLKLAAIYRILKLHLQNKFSFFLCQRHQSIYVATHIPGSKVIGVIHGAEDYKRPGRRLWLYWHKKKLFLLAVSDVLRDTLRQKLTRFPGEQIQTLHNSIDPKTISEKFIARSQAREELGLSDYFWFVQIARLSPEKDQTTLIRSFAKIAFELPTARLAIMGAGPLKEQLETLAIDEKINDKVVFLGNIPDGYRYLLAFDAFILSSLREGCPMVLLEAMMAGLPIIATKLPALSEVLEKLAWRFTPENVGQLSDLMKAVYLLNDEERNECKIRLQQHIINHFSTDSMRKEFWKIENAQGRNRTGTGD